MINKFLLTCIVLLLTTLGVKADVIFSVYSSEIENGEMTLTAVGKPEAGWHVASKAFVLEDAKNAEIIGNIVQTDSCTYTQRVKIGNATDFRVKGYFRYTACSDQMCLAPKTIEFSFPVAAAMQQLQPGTQPPADEPIDEAFTQGPVTGGLWQLFLLGVIGGLLALLTPCVWPIIPMTVSYFLKSGRKGAFFYGGCIVVIFLTLGVAMTTLMGANAMNQLATDAVFNLVCFAVLVVFGLSFMGLFTLQLPQSWANKLDERADRVGGLVGIFFMALTLVVVSFSCTAPIVGTLLVSMVSDGGVLAPVVGMLGFALALALPFTLFALFPQWMKKMPKSGEWMVRVKVILGVIELAFSLKFLSVADMAYGWGILPRWAFFAVWAALFAGLGLYLIGAASPKCRLAAGGKANSCSTFRRNVATKLLPAVASFAFAVYLARGIFGAPCTLVAAFAPPTDEEMNEAPLTDRDFQSFDEILTASRRSGKPLFVDFTGYGCVNCRKMEAAVFTDPRVKKLLKEKFYYVALHVDDRTPLPQAETVAVRGYDRKLRTVGDRWAAVEEERFGSVSQPMYVIIKTDGTQSGAARYYDEDVDAFIKWLQSGMK